MEWHYGTLGRATDAPGAARPRRRQRRRAARRGRGHHQRGRDRRSSPRCRPSRIGARSGGVCAASHSLGAVSPFTADAGSRASGSAVAAFGAGGGGRASARNSTTPTEAEEIWRYSRIGELDLDGIALAEPGRPSAPDAIAAAGRGRGADCRSRAAFVMVVDGQLVHRELDDALRARASASRPDRRGLASARP